MKALSKSPNERYQSGQELVKDLEACKSGANTLSAAAKTSKTQTAAASAGAGASGNAKVSTPVTAGAPASVAGPPKARASTSPTVEPPSAKPAFKVDPMMADDEGTPAAAARRSFSEMSELPPLREVYVAPPPPPAAEEPEAAMPQVVLRKPAPEKAAVQVREAAQKAVTEIRTMPPKLFLFAVTGAILLIALIIVGMTISNYMQDRDSSGAGSPPPQPEPVAAKAQPPAEAAPAQSPSAQPGTAEPPASQLEAAATPAPEPPVKSARGKKAKSRAMATAIPAQLSVSSNPPGAEITFDGNALCTAPCTLTGIPAGQHVVSASKADYNSESRTVLFSAGTNSSLSLQLGQLGARLSVASTPAGAVILIDGKDTGKLTPSQFTLNQAGAHTVVLRRYGYLEETSTVNTEPGQSANVSVSLKQLGSTDEIRAAGGKFKKVFGGGGDTGGMGIVSIKTQPKGAQIMLNNRVLEKTSPFDFYLNPGTYVVDIILSGYRPVHRVISVDQRDKVAIEVALSPE
jgi:hypothetical protein